MVHPLLRSFWKWREGYVRFCRMSWKEVACQHFRQIWLTRLVDVAGMKIGDTFRVKDLEIAKNKNIHITTDPKQLSQSEDQFITMEARDIETEAEETAEEKQAGSSCWNWISGICVNEMGSCSLGNWWAASFCLVFLKAVIRVFEKSPINCDAHRAESLF